MRRSSTLLSVLAFALIACHHDQPPPQVAKAPPPAPKAEPAKPAPALAPAPVTPNLAVSGDLLKRCAMHFANVQESPKFDYDQTSLMPQDRDLLTQIATCVTSGPLKGKRVELVGHTDPRGTDEYNLGLGDRRARTVYDYLRRLGVGDAQLAEHTRGELDATGRDEDGWRVDRRVDVQLAN
jgi:peptidoglycan-associated lipoprotein